MRINTKQYAFAAGILLGTLGLASADTILTFQVDMTQQVLAGTFTNDGSHAVYARGTFNGYGTYALTNNPTGVNTNLYTGTVDDTTDANGAQLQYKYCIDAGGWESGGNRAIGLPATSGAGLRLPYVYFNDQPRTDVTVTDNITFQVDMTEQIVLGAFIPGTSTAYVRGIINGWGQTALTNNPAAANTNIYSTVIPQTDAPSNLEHYKFYIDTGGNWENPQGTNAEGRVGDVNRFYNLLPGSGDITLPVVYFNDQGLAPAVTNTITFQVDMTYQVIIGHFDPSANTVECRGSFNNWAASPGVPLILTNNPSGANTNLFVGVLDIVGTPFNTINYKFWDSNPNAGGSGYESPSSTGGGNRSFNLLGGNGSITRPSVFFSDLTSTADFLLEDTIVTFTVNMTNAVTSDTHTAFDPGADTVYLNGDFINWNNNTWNVLLPSLTNNPVGSELYSIMMTIPKGNPVALTYKYSINGTDNEAGFAQNHVRYVRQGTTYTLPMDTFGNQYNEPGFPVGLSIGAPSGGKALISWLGRPGVHLQTKSGLAGGSWYNALETDGNVWTTGITSTNGFVSRTNYPVGATPTFFRLIKPGQ
jgi:hypothetical protein